MDLPTEAEVRVEIGRLQRELHTLRSLARVLAKKRNLEEKAAKVRASHAVPVNYLSYMKRNNQEGTHNSNEKEKAT